jgi:3-hydroxybutyryl-CoA dehydrogenase
MAEKPERRFYLELKDIKKIGVVGAGTMGHGIAISYALWGYPVIMGDLNEEILKNSLGRIKSSLDSFVEEEVVPRRQADETAERIITTTDLSALAGEADLVCEAIIERAQEKRELFNQLDVLCPSHTILASNTSHMVLNDFASEVKRQDKIVVTHYANPPHICPAVEVVKGPGTSDETFSLTYALLEKVRKVPVRVLKELPGYLNNRIQFALFREAFDLWAQGVASAEDIDRAVMGHFGFRNASIGPLMTTDLGGVPKWGPLAYEIFSQAFKFISDAKEPPQKWKEQVMNHRGFYDYSEEQWEEIIRKRDKEFLRRLKQLYWSKED